MRHTASQKGTAELALNMWLQFLLPHYAHVEFATVFPVLKICLKDTDLCVSVLSLHLAIVPSTVT